MMCLDRQESGEISHNGFHLKYGVTLLPLQGVLMNSTYPGRCPGLCTAAPSGRKITCEYGYTISATKSTHSYIIQQYIITRNTG